LQQAARLRPSDPTIAHDLGLACLETGPPAEAVPALERAIATGRGRPPKAADRLVA
jgi:Flp pilus assembly protein TadD